MEEIEFRKLVFSDPENPGPEALAAAARDPDLAAILDQARNLEKDLDAVAHAIQPPKGLDSVLLALPEADLQSTQTADKASTGVFPYFAVAASLILAVGLVFGLDWRSTELPADLAMGNTIIEHLIHEEAEIAAIEAGELTTVVSPLTVERVLANAGANFTAIDRLNDMTVRYANPCLVLPGNRSAHLIVQTARGPLNVIVIDNSPVERDLSIGNDQFSGLIIPMDQGNLVLIGESEEEVRRQRDVFADNIGWAI